MSEGESLDGAMARWPAAFTAAEAAAVRSGRAGRSLPETLRLLADHREVALRLTYRIASALVYPTVLGLALVSLLLFLVLSVLPKFMALYKDLGVTHNQLPLLTRSVAWVGGHVFTIAAWLAIPLMCALLLLWLFVQSSTGRLRWDYARLRTPLVGPILYDAALSRATSLLGLLLSRNVPLVEALRLAGEGAGNAVLAAGLANAAEQVAAGERVSAALQHTGLFPEGLSWRAAVAERGDELGAAFQAAGAAYVEQTHRRVQAFSAVIEPLLIILLGVVVAMVIVGCWSPMVTVLTQLSS